MEPQPGRDAIALAFLGLFSLLVPWCRGEQNSVTAWTVALIVSVVLLAMAAVCLKQFLTK
jgi:hypothetical protein